jgi:TonB family protein
MTDSEQRVSSAEEPNLVRFVNANSGFKARWDRQVTWSTGVSVALHVGFLLLLPGWRLGAGIVQQFEPETDIILINPIGGEVSAGGEAGGGALALGAPVVFGDEDPLGTSTTGVEGGRLSDREGAELREALGDRVRRGRLASPVLAIPSIAATAPAANGPAPDAGGDAEDEEAPSIAGDAELAALAALPEPDSLQLDRLSALRPELAFMSASAWVLIRNQAEVEAYLRRSYREGLLDESATGSVSITLWIDRRGSVEWAEISKSSGRPDLDEFTLALFNEVADFRAARERGLYISRSVTFSVNYPW